jgi:hypothetical protein
MRKILVLVVIVLCFLATDTAISAILAVIYGVINHLIGSAYSIASVPEAALFIGILRLIYCFVFTVFLFYFLNNIINLVNKALQLSIINLLVYTSLSVAFAAIVNPNDVFLNPLFYVIGISTFISPYLLTYIPYFRQLIVELYNQNNNVNNNIQTV